MSFRLKCLSGETSHSGVGATATTATTATEPMQCRQPVAKVATVAVAAERKRESQDRAVPLARFSESDRAAFERTRAGMLAEIAQDVARTGFANYRTVTDPQTGERLVAVVAARRQPDGTITVSEIAGTWDDPRVADLTAWTPPGEPS